MSQNRDFEDFLAHHGCCGGYLGALFAPRDGGLNRRGFFGAGLSLAAFGAALAANQASAQPRPAAMPKTAETIYVGGPIITMNDRRQTAEALAVAGGRIAAVGSRAQVMAMRGPGTRVVDLQGASMTPGLFDAHGHITLLAMTSAFPNLQPPPAGKVTSIADIQATLRAFLQAHPGGVKGWVFGFGYDETMLPGGRAPTREDLDQVSTELPVAILHVSAHLIVANSKALAAAGIGPDTADPPGGKILRGPDGKTPTGVLQETAIYMVAKVLPEFSRDDQIAGIERALAVYARQGVTTVQDGATLPNDYQVLRAAADAGRLKLDVVSYINYVVFQEMLRANLPMGGPYAGRFRVGGLKLIMDGSIQGTTAWFNEPYFQLPPGQPAGYRGFQQIPDDKAAALIEAAYARNLQVLAHCNGDAASEQFIRVVAEVQGRLGGADRRTTMIHAQTVTEAQLDRMAMLNIIPSFFVSHCFYWGDWHREIGLGPTRAARISPMQSALARGMQSTIHNDTPIVPADLALLIWSAVNRATRTGFVLGPDQRVSTYDALATVTRNGARQYGEERDKGTLEPGKRADLAIFDHNPLTMDPTKLKDLKVVETIKDGATIYRA